MSLTASLDASSVTAEPGGETVVPLQILNSGSTVEEYRFEVVGACAPWVVVEPSALSLYPGASGTVALRFSPPRDPSVPAGETPFGIRVTPTSDQGATTVPEGRVTVAPFTEVTSELVPRSSHGALRGRHQLAVDNRGNAPVAVRLDARTGTERARVVLAAAELLIPPGHADFGKLRVRPAKRMWRGTPVTHPFQVVATPSLPHSGGEGGTEGGADGFAPGPGTRERPEPLVLDGAYEQQPILPRWLPRALMLAAVLVLVLVGLWYALLRPAVKSAAREAITPEALASAAARTPSPGGTANGGGTAGAGGGSSAGTGPGAGGESPGSPGADGGSGSGSGSGGAQGAGGTPTSARVEVRDAVGGGSGSGSAYKVPAGSSFALTDVVVQNPQGDAGTLVVSSQDAPVLRLALENFRDSDYHFVTPIVVPGGGEITMTVDCRQVGRPVKAPTPAGCEESLLLGGTLRTDTP